jgi:hypothetical protein
MLSAHGAGFSPDGNRLLLGSSGTESIKLWDFESRQELLTLPSSAGPFPFLRFQDADTIVGTTNDREYVWRAPSWAEIATAEAKERAESKKPLGGSSTRALEKRSPALGPSAD